MARATSSPIRSLDRGTELVRQTCRRVGVDGMVTLQPTGSASLHS